MAIIWIEAKPRTVFEALDAIEQAVDHQRQLAQLDERFMEDTYLAENATQLQNSWSIDMGRVVPGRNTVLGRAFEAGQRVVRKLSWWYGLPQLQQITEFHAATVRTIDAMITHLHHLTTRMQTLEAMHSEQRLRSIESQLRAIRDEQLQLRQRIAELEQQLRPRTE